MVVIVYIFIGCKDKPSTWYLDVLLFFFVVSHIQRIGCQPEKTTLHGPARGLLNREKRTKEKVWLKRVVIATLQHHNDNDD